MPIDHWGRHTEPRCEHEHDCWSADRKHLGCCLCDPDRINCTPCAVIASGDAEITVRQMWEHQVKA